MVWRERRRDAQRAAQPAQLRRERPRAALQRADALRRRGAVPATNATNATNATADRLATAAAPTAVIASHEAPTHFSAASSSVAALGSTAALDSDAASYAAASELCVDHVGRPREAPGAANAAFQQPQHLRLDRTRRGVHGGPLVDHGVRVPVAQRRHRQAQPEGANESGERWVPGCARRDWRHQPRALRSFAAH